MPWKECTDVDLEYKIQPKILQNKTQHLQKSPPKKVIRQKIEKKENKKLSPIFYSHSHKEEEYLSNQKHNIGVKKTYYLAQHVLRGSDGLEWGLTRTQKNQGSRATILWEFCMICYKQLGHFTDKWKSQTLIHAHLERSKLDRCVW